MSLSCLLPALLLMTAPLLASAQLVHGRIIDGNTSQPIRGATAVLLDDRDRVILQTLADSAGTFRLRAWTAGKYRVRASMLGYSAVTSQLLELATGESFELAVRMTVEAVRIDSVTVVSRSRNSLTDVALRGYYDRRDAGRRIGMGRFLDRGEIEQKGTKLSDVLRRTPGLRVIQLGRCIFISASSNPTGTNPFNRSTRSAGGCADPPPNLCLANIYLDGLLLKYDDIASLDSMIPLAWVEAIEVYRRASELPAEFLDNGACGVVALWTRHG